MPFEVLGNQAAVGISIGIAMSPEAGTDRIELARKADIALYEAKKGGHKSFQFFTEEMSETLCERHALEVDLRLALDACKQLEVVYQPVYSTEARGISAIEALVRWNHPRFGSVPPTLFVALAEECGLINRLGEWVLREACRMARDTNIRTVAVNASPSQFLQPDFAKRVLSVLNDCGMTPDRLEIEITEGTLLESSGISGRVLKALRAAGVRIALDDFGTGYSSLSYLIKLEVDRIKIDRSFVQHLTYTSPSCSIIQAIVTMAHAVGVAVTAEGVETHEQREILTDIGCNSLQGYLLSRPVSASKLAEMMATGETHVYPQKTEAA
jgi:EAL domain-containing protein (putative c-di-GMP-specific phosphodiesterase class I)